MQSLRSVIKKIEPKLRSLEENPTITLMVDVSEENGYGDLGEPTYEEYTGIGCIFSEQPETIISSSAIITQKAVFFYIHEDNLPDDIVLSLTNRIVYNNDTYRPTDLQNIFGLWRTRVEKIN